MIKFVSDLRQVDGFLPVSFFIEVPVPSRENKRPFICVLGVSMILSFSYCFYDFPKIRQDKFYLKTAC